VNLLAIDASSLPASCALYRGGALAAESYVHNKLTHSQTLMPMVQRMLENAGLTPAGLNLLAVTAGPGSFTGLRIGIAAVKGMAWGAGKPCLPVSTLEALAWNGVCHRGVVCAVMDARCAQVYAALFDSSGTGGLAPLGRDEALPLAQLCRRVEQCRQPVLLVGDGAELCYNNLDRKEGVVLAPANLRFQRASSVGLAALAALAAGARPVEAAALAPVYLRLPQAERELLQKQQAARK